MITARLAQVLVHSLLHHHPAPILGDDEGMKIELISVLDRGAVDLRHEPARARQAGAVDAHPIADLGKLERGLTRMASAAAAHEKSKLAFERSQSAFEGPDDARRDAGRMPVHAHDRAEGLEPEGMRQAA